MSRFRDDLDELSDESADEAVEAPEQTNKKRKPGPTPNLTALQELGFRSGPSVLLVPDKPREDATEVAWTWCVHSIFPLGSLRESVCQGTLQEQFCRHIDQADRTQYLSQQGHTRTVINTNFWLWTCRGKGERREEEEETPEERERTRSAANASAEEAAKHGRLRQQQARQH